jgi:phosphoribosyl 1,2-cyclic phosphodiesterase
MTLEFGGNTTCLEVQAGPHLIIIDAGTGIVGLGEKLAARRAEDRQPIVGTMLFTHGHHDHTQGLPFFAPLSFDDSVFHVFGPRVFDDDLGQVLARSLHPSVFPQGMRPLPGMHSTYNVYGNQVILVTQRGVLPVVLDTTTSRGTPFMPPWAVKIWVHHSANHPKGGSLCYRIEYRGKRLVFATDTEGYVGGDTVLTEFVRNVDLLIHDAEYTDKLYTGPPSSRQGWGHSTWKMAIEVGRRANVKRLALTHHNAEHDDAFLRDFEKAAQAAFPKAFLVREGLTVSL